MAKSEKTPADHALPLTAAQVASLLEQNNRLRADLEAARQSADDLNEKIGLLLQHYAEQDAERRHISKDIRRRLKGRDVADDSRRQRTLCNS